MPLLPLLLLALVPPRAAAGEALAGRDLEALAAEARLRSFQALAGLDLTQTETLAGLAERVAGERDRYLARRASLLAIQKATFTAFRHQNLDGGELTPLVERNTAEASHLGDKTRNEFVASLAGIDALAREVLDPGQLLLVDLLGPEELVRCALGEADRAPGEPLLRQAWGALEAVAGEKGRTLERLAGDEARQLLAVAAREGQPAWDPAAEEERIAGVLERAACLSDRAAERCRGALAREILPRTKTEHAREGLARIHAEKVLAPSTLLRLLLAEGAASILRGGEAADLTPERRAVRELEADVETLRDQISLLNLLNGLHLSRAQLAALASCGERAAAARAKEARVLPSALASIGLPPGPGEPPDGAEGRERLGREMQRLSDELGRGRLPVAKRVRRIEAIAGRRPAGPAGLSPEAAAAGAREVLAVLTPAQEQVLLDFNRCLLPPPELKDPVRVGQAGGNERRLRELALVRDVPAERYGARRAQIAEGALFRLEKLEGSFSPDAREAVVAELLAIFDEARALDDAAFAVRSAELVARLENLGLATRLKEELAGDRETELASRAANLLLDRYVPELAREIVARREQRGLPDPVDLETIAPAPSCKDGKCAVD
ncbi:MAG: hypothetical protein AB1726_18980 [Planctomycetota bacterium]